MTRPHLVTSDIPAEWEVTFVCPFCLGTAAARKDLPAVMHSLPPCRRFVELEAQDFLHAVNQHARDLS